MERSWLGERRVRRLPETTMSEPGHNVSSGARNLVERSFNKIKQSRVATPYDKLAANYLAFVQLAPIRLWLRVNEATA